VSSTDDQLIADYMNRLEIAADILPPDRRAELIEEIRTHIAEARAAQAGSTSPDPGGAAAVLDRLGSPEDIVRAAAEHGGTGSPFEPGSPASGGIGPTYSSVGYGQPAGGGPAGSPPGWGYGGPSPNSARQGLGWLEVVAIVLLLVGGFLAGIGWIAGVIMLWLSPRWRLSDKLLGTLVWPGGLAAVVVVLGAATLSPTGVSTCSGNGSSAGQLGSSCSTAGGLPGWAGPILAIALIVIGLGGPILVTVRLVRQAQRWAHRLPDGPAATQSL
jgi:hypothetical protein